MIGAGLEHSKFTFKTALQLAAPHTWSGSILPVLLALSCALAFGFEASPLLVCILLAISVFMQASVNTLNDYFDFVKGVDSAEDNLDVDDAALVYSNVSPNSALRFAVALLAAAFLLGVYVIWVAGWVPLAIAVVGAAVVFAYSAGKTPISYLPIGEVVSGFVMGCLVTVACYFSITLTFGWEVFVWSLPLVLQIGLIMLTNNTCDIEKDVEAGRRTLPVLLGRPRSIAVYRSIVAVDYLAIVAVVFAWFPEGAIILPFLALLSLPLAMNIWKCPFDQASRIQAMSLVTSFNAYMGCMYCICIVASAV